MTNNDGQARQMRKWSDTKVFPAFCHRRKSFLRGLTFSFLNSPTYFSIIRAQRFSTFDNLIISALRTISAPSLFFLVFLFLFFFSFSREKIKERPNTMDSFEQSATGHSSVTKNEFLFFTTGKQTRSIIARVESLTFRLPPLIITLRRGVIQLSFKRWPDLIDASC